MEPKPQGIMPLIRTQHRGYRTVKYLVDVFPEKVDRKRLRMAAGISGRDPRHSANFEWHLLRINDTLPLTGWQIESNETDTLYWLEPINEGHHMRLVREFQRRREHASGT
jgi:hypothetical protein